MYCKVVGCVSDSKHTRTTWHRFPKCEHLRKIWLAKINRLNYGWREGHHICGRHFADPDDFVSPSPMQAEELKLTGKRRFNLKANATPSLLLGKREEMKKPRHSLALAKRQNIAVSRSTHCSRNSVNEVA